MSLSQRELPFARLEHKLKDVKGAFELLMRAERAVHNRDYYENHDPYASYDKAKMQLFSIIRSSLMDLAIGERDIFVAAVMDECNKMSTERGSPPEMDLANFWEDFLVLSYPVAASNVSFHDFDEEFDDTLTNYPEIYTYRSIFQRLHFELANSSESDDNRHQRKAIISEFKEICLKLSGGGRPQAYKVWTAFFRFFIVNAYPYKQSGGHDN